MSSLRPYVFEHTECLRERKLFRPGGDGFALIAQNPVQLIGPHGEVRSFVPGATLFNQLTDDLEAGLRTMLSGTAARSAARFGVSWIIAHRRGGRRLPGGVLMHDEDRIDDWLDMNTAVLHGTLPPTLRPDVEPGPFNDLSRTWQAIESS